MLRRISNSCFRPRTGGAFLCFLAAASGCGWDDLSPGMSPAAPDPAGDDEPVGLVELALERVPEGVACLRVTAHGPYREKIVYFDTEPEMPLAETITGLPLGRLVFLGEAFGSACEKITARTVAGWVSDPAEVSVSENSKAKVTLLMQRNGRADVEVQFNTDPICGPPGGVCASARDCCAGRCSGGRCEAPANADAGPDGG